MDGLCKTEYLIAGDSRDETGIERGGKLLRQGGIVAFPTETVYGLGANAFDEQALARIFRAKGRPSWDPLIVHVSSRKMFDQIVLVPNAVRDRVECLIAAFWPGPLTLLLPRSALVRDGVTAGRPLVGVRMPAHPVAHRLIECAGVPVAAPSANRFGHTSPTTAAHVLEDLDGRIDAVVDGGATAVGVESTVLDPAEMPMVIYRPGAVTREMIEAATGSAVRVYVPPGIGTQEPQSLPSPGIGLRHYAPRARLVLVDVSKAIELAGSLEAAVAKLGIARQEAGAMLPEGWQAPCPAIFDWGLWGDAEMLARRLFAGLRALDARGVSSIVCPLPEVTGMGAALRDRLEKAAYTGESQ